MRIKRPFIIHNLSRGFSVFADGVKETQDFLRANGCTVNNNIFASLVSDVDNNFNGKTITSKTGELFEVDELWTGDDHGTQE